MQLALPRRFARLFRILRDRGEELRRRLSLTPYNEVDPEAVGRPADDDIEQAQRDFVRWRQSLCGRGDSFSFTLRCVRRKMVDVISGDVSANDKQPPLIVGDYVRFRSFADRPPT